MVFSFYKSNNYCLTATRFTNKTWEENEVFREKMKHPGCIYGVPKEIPAIIEKDTYLYVFEMNNSYPSQIMGMGIIKNDPRNIKHFRIHNKNDYNRFCYYSKHRLDRTYLEKHHKTILELVENAVFKGKDHIKRGQGISRLPEKKLKKDYKDLKEFIKLIADEFLIKKL